MTGLLVFACSLSLLVIDVCTRASQESGCFVSGLFGGLARTVQAPNYVGDGRVRTEGAGGWKEEYMQLPITWAKRPLMREHRTVMLPDFQGCGLGSSLSNAVARDLELQDYTT